jgi:hypothetical protein
MNSDLATVGEWMIANRLKLNVRKCKVMVLRGSRKKFNPELISGKIILDNSAVQYVEKARSLGLEVDCHLKFSHHSEKIQRRASAGINTLKFLIKGLPLSAALPIYNAFVACHFDYCAPVWSGTTANILNPLMKLQRWALGVVCHTKISSFDLQLFSNLGILTLQRRWEYLILSWSWRAFHAKVDSVTSLLLRFKDSEGFHSLRRTLSVDCSMPKTKMFENSFSFRAMNFLKNLPNDIFACFRYGSLPCFQTVCHRYLLNI